MDTRIWEPSICDMRNRNRASLSRLKTSLNSLQNQSNAYAEDHRLLIAVYADIVAVIERHIEAAGTIPPAPPPES